MNMWSKRWVIYFLFAWLILLLAWFLCIIMIWCVWDSTLSCNFDKILWWLKFLYCSWIIDLLISICLSTISFLYALLHDYFNWFFNVGVFHKWLSTYFCVFFLCMKSLVPFQGWSYKSWSKCLDGLTSCSSKYYNVGAVFSKWRVCILD